MRSCILFFVSLISVTGFTQTNDPVPSFPAYIIKSGVGVHPLMTLNFTDSDWAGRTPEVPVPDSYQVNLDGVDQFNNEIDRAYVLHTLSFIHNKEKQAEKNHRFTTTVHLGTGPQVTASKHWFNESREVLDTLVSLQTGTTYYVTGNKRVDIQKAYSSKSFVLGVGEHFATNPEKLFQFETGIDFLMLFISGETQSYIKESYEVEGAAGGSAFYPHPVLNEPQSIRHDSESLYGLIIRVPLEVSVPLSCKNPVLKRMRVGIEANLGCEMYFARGKTQYFGIASAGFNFRYEFYKFRSPFRWRSQTPASN